MWSSVCPYGACILTGVVCLQSVVNGFTEDYGPTHVRTWSDWYNTDHPDVGGGDDESVASIRQRGYEICDGSAPLDAVCRIADEKDVVFNERTTGFTRDYLAIDCTTNGIQCRDSQQPPLSVNRTCRDYEIRFECLSLQDQHEEANFGIIGIAAGLSVIIPILCVIVMHLVRLAKHRRRLAQSEATDNNNTGSQDQESQTINSNLPPSYEQLFGEEYGSTENLIGPGSSVASLPVTSINRTESQGTESSSPAALGDSISAQVVNQTERGLIYNISDGQLSSMQNVSDNSTMHEENELELFRRVRLPGMHLSIFDLITSHDSGFNSPQRSPQLSPEVIRTPPPSYKDALEILGGMKSKPNSDK